MMIAMKQHSDGLQHLEDMTTIHIKELLRKIEARGNQAVDPNSMIKKTLGKLMMTLTYGSDCEEGLTQISKVEEESSNDLFIETGPCMILNFCPLLRYIVPSVRNIYDDLIWQMNTYREVFTDITKKRKHEFDGKNPEVYIDHFLNLLVKSAKTRTGTHFYLL